MFSFLKKISSFQIILLGFAVIILLGSLLLMLPISVRGDGGASFSDALFTSVSAVCVTGLVVRDTATYWSEFGQMVILFLIQIGGLGVVSAASAISLIAGRKINLRQRSTMQEAISAPQMGGVVRLTGFILKMTFIAELIGCLLLFPAFYKEFGYGKGLYYSVFHSVSAFCNAGFDLMGETAHFSSLTSFIGNPLVNITIMLLIISGGLGFSTWEDFCTNRFRFKKYHLQSKIVLVTTAALIVLPSVFFYVFEFSDWGMTTGNRVLASIFQAVTPRTAGFNTVDFAAMKQGTLGMVIILMLIGGSTGSTAGGIKTTTFAVLLTSAFSVMRSKKDTHLFGRRIDETTVCKASALLILYITLFFFGGVIICFTENLPLLDCLFESASAIGTVGLSMGLTPTLGTVSRIVLICLMFFGRVGGLTFVFAAFNPDRVDYSAFPLEKINIG